MLGRFALILTLSTMAQTGASQAEQGVVGAYCLEGVMEVSSCISLNADHTFTYSLSYGAYDETSEGLWQLNGNEIVLQSNAYGRKPRFTFKESRTRDGDTFNIVVVNATGGGLAGVDVRVRCDGSETEGYTQEDGYETPCKTAPSEIALGLRMFGLAYEVVPISGELAGKKALAFSFEPGDLGKKEFSGTRLQRDGDGLSMVYRSQVVGDLDNRLFSYRRAQAQ
jgi:hypothetical protein